MATASWWNTAPPWWGSIWKRTRDGQQQDRIEADGLTKQVAAALILQEENVLCCQRTEYQALPLKWEFPGGKIEPGEDAPAALQRELEEELGIRAHIGRKVAQMEHHYVNGNAVELHFFLVEQYEGEMQNRIFREIRWVNPRELPKLDFLDADRKLVEQLANGELL
jgi:8-oxo-dGTP diphosphatase